MNLLHLPSAPVECFLFYWCEAKDCSCPFQTWQSHLLWIDLVTLDFSKHILKKNSGCSRELPLQPAVGWNSESGLESESQLWGAGGELNWEVECVEIFALRLEWSVEVDALVVFENVFILCLWIFVLCVCLCTTACLVPGATWSS